MRGIAPVATRTGIHRGDQLEVGRERQRAAGAGDGDDVVFQRLAQRFQRSFVKLGQFVK